METKQRQDNHRNDRPDNSQTGENNEDDFILFKNGDSGPTIRPYGLWFDTRNNNRTNTLWVASTEGSGTNKTAKLYAYETWWETTDSVPEPEGKEQVIERYLMGKRFTETNGNRVTYPRDITLEKLTEAPELNTVGNPVVFEVVDGETTTNKFQYEYALDEKKYYMIDSAGNRLGYDGQGNLRSLDAAGNPTGRSYITSTNMVRGPIGNLSPTGIWSDGTTMWVADQGDTITIEINGEKEKYTSPDRIYAYNLWTNAMGKIWTSADIGENPKMFDGSRREDKEFRLSHVRTQHLPNNHPQEKNAYAQGIWSDGETMWVADTQGAADSDEKRIYAYNMTTKLRDPDKDFKTLNEAGNDRPRGIWSDGTTMWVADQTDNKLYAFSLPQGGRASTRDADRDLDTLDASGNHVPRGLWSDETTMWVANSASNNKKIYAYRLSNAASLGSLTLKGHIPPGNHEYKDFEVQIHPSFDSGTTRYTASVPYATSHLTVSPKTLRTSEGGFSYSPAEDATTTDGHQVSLAVGNNRIAVTVTNRQATGLPRTRTYEVNVKREFYTFNDPSKDVSLSTSWMPTNVVAQGLWTDGAAMWLSARETTTMQDQNGESTAIHSGKLYSYNLQSTNLVVSTNTLRHNNPYGIWANKTTMWVADYDATFTKQKDGETITHKKILAYKMSDRTRESTKDFDLDPSNSNPQWIWSDGVTMWVSDNATITNIVNGQTYQKIYAYEVSGRDRWADKDILLEKGKLHTNNDFEDFAGMWSDGATLWIADNADAKIYAYKLKTDESPRTIHCPDATEDFNTLAAVDNTDPKGIYSDGTTMWVVDSEKKKIFAYNQPLSANNKLKRLALSDNDGDDNVYYGDLPFSLHFSNNETNYMNGVYVLYRTTSTTVTAIAQDPDAGVEITPKDQDLVTPGHQINLADGDNPITITVTAENAAVQEYTINVTRKSGGHTPIKDFGLAGANTNAMSLWANKEENEMWVMDGIGKRFYVYQMNEANWGSLVTNTSKLFGLLMGENENPQGIWSDKTTMWVADSGDDKLYAYNLNLEGGETNRRDDDTQAKDFGTSDSNNGDPRGIWSNNTTMWVADNTASSGGHISGYHRWLYAYKMTGANRGGGRDINQDIKLDDGNAAPGGIWSNSTNMWVLDVTGKKVFAYTFAGVRKPDMDFNLNEENAKPWGIWSDDTTMWVTDSDDDKLYAYNLPQPLATGNSGPSEDSTLKDLRLSGIGLNPTFSPDKEIYTALVDHDVASTTVTASPNDSGASVIIFSGVRGTTRVTASSGPRVVLKEGDNIIAVDVTAENGSIQTYLVFVTKSEAPPVSGGPLPQNFQPSAVGGASQSDLASSSSGGGWKSRLISAETLPGGEVRFVFLVVSAEEFRLETSSSLISGNWRLLPDGEFKVLRDNGDGQDRLTIILPQAEGKQRFLRLTSQR